MTYPGNSSLTADVQQRILTTFRQSVQSAARGSRDEAMLGCDFVLRLDPQFQPAKTLQQMLAAHREPAAYEALLAELDGGAPAPAAAVSGGDLRATFAQMLEERRFAELLNAAERDKRIIASDPELAALVEQAQGRYEAEPYVVKFVESAAEKLAAGDSAEAERLLAKARSLDPTHPRLAEVAGAASGPDFGAPAPAEPGGLPDLDFGSLDLPSVEEAGFGTLDLEAGAPESEGDAAPRAPEETSGRIVSLLSEGQAAFDRGEYQAAIDAWSRIFLIDIDHDEAARKIERARQLKAEQEREVEEIFHEGVAQFDAGDLAASRAAFRRVLEIQPSYALAREYLDKLDEREAGGSLPGAGLPELAPIEPLGTPRAEPRAASGESAAPAASGPAPERRRAAVGPSYVATTKRPAGGGPSPRLLLLGGGVLALLAVGGWFLFSQRERLFPNTTEPEATAAAAAADPLATAQALHEEGKTAVALPQLKRLPPSHPNYAEAQALIAQWEAIPDADAASAADPVAIARRRRLLELAQGSLAEGENFRARRYFRQAAEIAPLEGDWVAMSAAAEERLAPLGRELDRFRDGDYEYLINALWRRREAEPSNRDVQRMLVDSYYNLGVLDLQRGDPGAAREKFREARSIDASDSEMQRLERFATTYENRAQDLLYRIFVKYAPLR